MDLYDKLGLTYNTTENIDHFGRMFFEIYNTLLGNFDFEGMTIYEKAFWMVASCSLALVLINLIVAIMGEAQSEVMG